MSKSVNLYRKEGAAFLQIEEVGSSIRWGVLAQLSPKGYGDDKDKLMPKLHASLYLTDCDRQISWSLADSDDMNKLDRAIEQLQACRKALAKAIGKLEPHGFGEEN